MKNTNTYTNTYTNTETEQKVIRSTVSDITTNKNRESGISPVHHQRQNLTSKKSSFEDPTFIESVKSNPKTPSFQKNHSELYNPKYLEYLMKN